jgi:hypothetical protein
MSFGTLSKQRLDQTSFRSSVKREFRSIRARDFYKRAEARLDTWKGRILSAMTNVECMGETVKLPVEAFACRPRDPGRPESKLSTADRGFSNPQLTALKSRLMNYGKVMENGPKAMLCAEVVDTGLSELRARFRAKAW